MVPHSRAAWGSPSWATVRGKEEAPRLEAASRVQRSPGPHAGRLTSSQHQWGCHGSRSPWTSPRGQELGWGRHTGAAARPWLTTRLLSLFRGEQGGAGVPWAVPWVSAPLRLSLLTPLSLLVAVADLRVSACVKGTGAASTNPAKGQASRLPPLPWAAPLRAPSCGHPRPAHAVHLALRTGLCTQALSPQTRGRPPHSARRGPRSRGGRTPQSPHRRPRGRPPRGAAGVQAWSGRGPRRSWSRCSGCVCWWTAGSASGSGCGGHRGGCSGQGSQDKHRSPDALGASCRESLC